MRFPKRIVSALGMPVLLAGLLAGPAWSESPFSEMAKHVPSHANSLCLVNADSVFASEIAKKQGWQDQRGKRFESGLTCIPPKATQVIIASQLDLEVMRPMWDVAIVAFAQAPSLADVKEHFGGIDDLVANTSVLRVADDSYVARFSDNLLGAFGPANRQLVASWLEQSNGQLSSYLLEALGYEEGGADVILAIDAANVITPGLIQQRLEAAQDIDLKKAKISVEKVTQILSSLRGVMLGITFGKEAYGKIRIDFGQDATPLGDIAKPLLLMALANHGAMIDEVTKWNVQTKGKTIFFDGPLGESGLTRISSLINLPTHALQAPVAASGATQPGGATAPAQSPSDPEQVVLETTQQYFKSVDRLLADLKSRKGEERTFGTIGVWFQNYANKVDRLPILNVDEEMLQYGQFVAQQLRNASMAIKGFGISKGVADVNADSNAAPLGGALGQSASNYYANGSYGRPLGVPAAYGWARGQGAAGTAYWAGRSEMRQAFAARAQVNSQLTASMATSVQGILEQLREAHRQVRVEMTKKYKVEF